MKTLTLSINDRLYEHLVDIAAQSNRSVAATAKQAIKLITSADMAKGNTNEQHTKNK